jgi:hypothetical protein
MACPSWERQIVLSDDPTVGWCQSCAESPTIVHNDRSDLRHIDGIESVVHELAGETVVLEVEGRMVNGVFPGDSDYEDGYAPAGAEAST